MLSSSSSERGKRPGSERVEEPEKKTGIYELQVEVNKLWGEASIDLIRQQEIKEYSASRRQNILSTTVLRISNPIPLGIISNITGMKLNRADFEKYSFFKLGSNESDEEVNAKLKALKVEDFADIKMVSDDFKSYKLQVFQKGKEQKSSYRVEKIYIDVEYSFTYNLFFYEQIRQEKEGLSAQILMLKTQLKRCQKALEGEKKRVQESSKLLSQLVKGLKAIQDSKDNLGELLAQAEHYT